MKTQRQHRRFGRRKFRAMRALAPGARIPQLKEHLRSVAWHVAELGGLRPWEVCRAVQGLASELEEEEHVEEQ